jgi:hypothetical protein
MKKLTLAALMACAGVIGMNAHAAGETADFNVIVNLESKCLINDGDTASLNNITLDYVSFQTTGPISGTTGFNLKCTEGLLYTMAFDANPRSALGLTYTLAHNASGEGVATGENVTITATIASGEVGTCAAGTCSATNAHTLTVTY